MKNILDIQERSAFRTWLNDHPEERECWVNVIRGRPQDDGRFYYLDAVEEALCFGWIDSVYKEMDGLLYQKFTPRKKKSSWTELNKERVRRLERLGLMTPAGRRVLPAMGPRSFHLDPQIEARLKQARVYRKYRQFPILYQRVRGWNLAYYRRTDPELYETAINRLIKETCKGRMYGEWNDYGRLLEVIEE